MPQAELASAETITLWFPVTDKTDWRTTAIRAKLLLRAGFHEAAKDEYKAANNAYQAAQDWQPDV